MQISHKILLVFFLKIFILSILYRVVFSIDFGTFCVISFFSKHLVILVPLKITSTDLLLFILHYPVPRIYHLKY